MIEAAGEVGSRKISDTCRRIRVARVLESRYAGGFRPLSWDERVAGTDLIESVEGEIVRLASSGQQSCPQPGWELVITGGDAAHGFSWTLYGLAPGAAVVDA
jgi:hypothetical protein